MNWVMWEKIEVLLHNRGIRPILAVVPDNKDPQLNVSAPRADFWSRVRKWQSWGWTIGLHGYQHVYSTIERGLTGLNARSEFAGLPADVQAAKLDAGLAIFRRENVAAGCWVAPGHSFDAVTVQLLRERRLDIISDGHFRRPLRWMGCIWVPQQLWRFRRMNSGVWTVCYHHNRFGEADLAQLEADVQQYAGAISCLSGALAGELPDHRFSDSLNAAAWLAALRVRRVLARAIG